MAIIGLLIVAALMFFGTWSALVNSDEECIKASGDIDSTLQRRYDLIPNLVNTVKGYMKHEDKVFTDVNEARAKVGQLNVSVKDAGPEQMQQFAAAQQQLSGALSKLLAVVESQPNIKANEPIMALMAQLEGTENRINVARTRYNAAVKNLNSKVRGPLGGIVANFLDVKRREPFLADDAARKAPKVEF